MRSRCSAQQWVDWAREGTRSQVWKCEWQQKSSPSRHTHKHTLYPTLNGWSLNRSDPWGSPCNHHGNGGGTHALTPPGDEWLPLKLLAAWRAFPAWIMCRRGPPNNLMAVHKRGLVGGHSSAVKLFLSLFWDFVSLFVVSCFWCNYKN